MKKKIVIGLPNASGLDTTEWSSQLLVIGMMLLEKGYTIHPVRVDKSLVDIARNTIIRVAQEQDADYVFFLDADTFIEPKGILELLELDKDIASPPVADRKGGNHLNLFYPGLTKYYELKETQEVTAVGMACTLIKRKVIDDMLKEYARPFEFQIATLDGKKVDIGEDVGFCLRAAKFGYKTWAVKGIKTGHMGEPIKYTYEG